MRSYLHKSESPPFYRHCDSLYTVINSFDRTLRHSPHTQDAQDAQALCKSTFPKTLFLLLQPFKHVHQVHLNSLVTFV